MMLAPTDEMDARAGDELRAVAIAVLTAAACTLASGLVTWGLDAVKRRVEAGKTADEPRAEGDDGRHGTP